MFFKVGDFKQFENYTFVLSTEKYVRTVKNTGKLFYLEFYCDRIILQLKQKGESIMKKRISTITAICLGICLLFLCGCDTAGGGSYGSYAPMAGPVMAGEASPDGSVSDDNYQYESVIEQGFVNTSVTPSSYFSLDRNTAGYSLMRYELKNYAVISPDSVRLEEYVNYFDYDYPAPEKGDGIGASAYLSPCPWNPEHKLLTVGLKTEESNIDGQGGNYVFLIDVSGSMSGTERLDLVKYSIKELVKNLSQNDTVTIVTYANGVDIKLRSMSASEKNRSTIFEALDSLTASGGTNGEGGLELAYECAEKAFRLGGNNRVVLMSDGDFNIGMSDNTDMKEFIQDKAKSGVYLSVLGFGMGNMRDDMLETLALNGNGNYAYIDTELEAKKVLCEELSGTLYTVAKDAKAGVTFNPETVNSYRLLGYDMKRMSESDFENTEKDAGEIGSNLTVTAIYEIELKEDAQKDSQIAEIHLKWKDTAENNKEKKITVTNTENGTEDTEFAICVAEFALVLRQSRYMGDASLENVLSRLKDLQNYINDDPYKGEFCELVSIAKEIRK